MFQWLKTLFNKPENLQGPVQPSKPWPRYDISEPVFAIERSMIEHPSQWKLTFKQRDSVLYNGGTINIHYTLLDTKNKLKFHGHNTRYYGYNCYTANNTSILVSWVTEQEKDYLIDAVRVMQNKKLARLERIKQVKKNKERERLMEIYK